MKQILFFAASFLLASVSSHAVINGTCLTGDDNHNAIERQIRLSSVKIGYKAAWEPGESYICSGTITGSNEITTAAHCTSAMRSPSPPTEYFVEINEFKGNRWSQRRIAMTFPIMSAAPLPYNIYDDSGAIERGDDVAKITLAEQVPAENIVSECERKTGIRSTGEFRAAGYGYSGETYSRDYNDLKLCYAHLKNPNFNSGSVQSQPTPSDPTNYQVVCKGDSGGGLFYRSGTKNKICLSGVVHGTDMPTGQERGLSTSQICQYAGARQIFSRVPGANTLDVAYSPPVYKPIADVGESLRETTPGPPGNGELLLPMPEPVTNR